MLPNSEQRECHPDIWSFHSLTPTHFPQTCTSLFQNVYSPGNYVVFDLPSVWLSICSWPHQPSSLPSFEETAWRTNGPGRKKDESVKHGKQVLWAARAVLTLQGPCLQTQPRCAKPKYGNGIDRSVCLWALVMMRAEMTIELVLCHYIQIWIFR